MSLRRLAAARVLGAAAFAVVGALPALAAVDDAKREALLQRATERAIDDAGIIPLHFQVNLWATPMPPTPPTASNADPVSRPP